MSPIRLLERGVRDLIKRPQGNVPALDALRSLAILLVFSTHFADEFKASQRVVKFPFFYYGWSGVDLFFVLSGFLIGSQLWKELGKSGRIHIGTFLLRRGLRIWPLYFSFCALILGEVVFGGRSGSGLLADCTFLSNYFHNQVGGSWSLSTEEQFYILAPVLISLFAIKLRPQRLWVVPALGLLIPIGARFFVVASSGLPRRDLQQVLYFPIHTHSDGLAVGLFLAWMTSFRPDWVRLPRQRIAIAAVMVAGGVGLYIINRLVFNFTTVGLIFGAATCCSIGSGKTPGLLNWNGFYLVSRLSYGLYLNHFGILPRLYAVLGHFRIAGGEPGFWICYLVAFAICLSFAAVTFVVIENPFLELRARWLTSKRATQPPGRAVIGTPVYVREQTDEAAESPGA